MEIILLERVDNLGQMGDVVTVKNGYARNFLIPQKKALRANEENKKRFENQRADLEARNLERKKEAEDVAKKIDGRSFVVIRQSSEMGLLYGSVTTRDIAETASGDGVAIDRGQVRLDKPIKTLGIVPVACGCIRKSMQRSRSTLHGPKKKPNVRHAAKMFSPKLKKKQKQKLKKIRLRNFLTKAPGNLSMKAVENDAEAGEEKTGE